MLPQNGYILPLSRSRQNATHSWLFPYIPASASYFVSVQGLLPPLSPDWVAFQLTLSFVIYNLARDLGLLVAQEAGIVTPTSIGFKVLFWLLQISHKMGPRH